MTENIIIRCLKCGTKNRIPNKKCRGGLSVEDVERP